MSYRKGRGLPEQAGRPSEQRSSGQSPPWVFPDQRESEPQKRRGKLEQGQSAGELEIKQKENLC